MTTSGTYTFDLTVAEVFDESFERAGIAPESITHNHIISAKRSLNLLLIDLANVSPDAQYRVDRETTTISSGSSSLSLASGTIDVIDVVVQATGDTVEIPVVRTNRDDYLRLPNKTQTATRPTQWYISHETLNAPAMVFWPVPDNTVTVKYDRLRWAQDVTAMSETLDARRNWLPVIIAGLAFSLAEKHNLERAPILGQRYMEALNKARLEMSGRGTVIMVGRGFGRSRRRRA